MATLKGLFEPKPRCKRNFLIENIREVKNKSSSNSQKNKEVSDKLKKSSVGASAQSQSHLNGPQRSATTSAAERFPNAKCDLKKSIRKNESCKNCPCGKPPTPTGSSSKRAACSARTVHYIHQENVPFEWTEVCPSLISHNICHQGVQTEEGNNDKISKSESCLGMNDLLDRVDIKSQNPASLHKMEGVDASDTRSNLPKSNSLSHIPKSFEHDAVRGKAGMDCRSKDSPESRDYQTNDMEIELNGHSNRKHNVESEHVEQVPGLNPHHRIPEFENLRVSSSRKATENGKGCGDPMVAPPSYQRGVIPKYLSKRKSEQAIASAKARDIDHNCPPGHVSMPDAERRETLDLILKKYNDLISELNKMPVRTDTLKMKQRKIEIEKQLDKLEEGIRVFSRSKVYVRLNA